MSKRWCLILLVLVMLTMVACGSRRPTLEREVPQVWHRPGSQSEREVVSSTTAGKGDQVRTQQQGKALLKWPDLWVRLYGDTNVSMEEVVPTNVRLSVDTGTALNGGVPRAKQRINLTTAYAEITFAGTVVMVAYHPGRQLTIVRVFAGQVEVRNLTGAVQTRLVGAREWALVRPGEPPQVSYRLEEMRALAQELGLWDVFHQVELDVQQGFGPAASRIASGDVDVVFIEPVTPPLLPPAPTWTPTPYVKACRPGVLYCEDFEDGRADGWDLWSGWTVEREGPNYILSGRGHNWATLVDQGWEWEDYRFSFRLKLLQGDIHLNYRLTEGPIRYFIGFHQGGLSLTRQIRDAFTDLAAVEAPHVLNRWYQLEIVGWGGHIQVYVDGKLELDYTDKDPLRSGAIAFETLDGSQALVDDIEVLPPGPESPPPPPPAGTPTPYVQPCMPGVFYCENFEDGHADGWELEPGWRVERDGLNYLLDGRGHNWATLVDQGWEWEDYRFSFRLKLLQGDIHLNYRLTEGPIRYFIGFHQGGLSLTRQIRDAFTDLAAVEAPHVLNRWYQLEIVGWGGHIQVYVDGKLELDYTDRAPLRRGTIAFETQDDSQALVDDIEVLPPGPESPPPPPAWTPTPTRTPLMRPTPTRTPILVLTPTRTPPPRPTSTPTATPDTTGPTITNVAASADLISWPPPYCSPNQVTISATIRDTAGVSGVKLTYRVFEGTRQGSWQALDMRQRATDTYAGTIGDAELKASLNPPVQLRATLEYYVQAFDGRGNRSQSSTSTVRVEYCIY